MLTWCGLPMVLLAQLNWSPNADAPFFASFVIDSWNSWPKLSILRFPRRSACWSVSEKSADVDRCCSVCSWASVGHLLWFQCCQAGKAFQIWWLTIRWQSRKLWPKSGGYFWNTVYLFRRHECVSHTKTRLSHLPYSDQSPRSLICFAGNVSYARTVYCDYWPSNLYVHNYINDFVIYSYNCFLLRFWQKQFCTVFWNTAW